MKRFDRNQSILLALKSRRIVKAEELAEEFNVSLRTIYRDIKSLMESGVPIYSEAGYGYSLDRDFLMRPVSLSEDEASALYFSALFSKRFLDKNTYQFSQQAMRKVQAILSDDTIDYIENLSERTHLGEGISKDWTNLTDIDLNGLHRAIFDCIPLKILYYSKYTDSENDRIIEPMAVFYLNDRWHLAAYCRLRKDYRDFRVDRIRSVKILEDHFKAHYDFNLKKFIDNQFKNSKSTAVPIRLEVTEACLNHLRGQPYFKYFKVEKFSSKFRLELNAPLGSWITFWILSMGSGCKILEPSELKDTIMLEMHKISELYFPS
jgi:predicted DNA-binding transcriptional regulator YafY